MLRKIWLFLFLKRTPTCVDVTRVLSESLERKLTIKERIALFFHYTFCYGCKRYDKQLHLIRDAVQGECDDSVDECCCKEQLSDECKNQIKERLREEMK